MKLKTTNGESFLSLCSWKREGCPDKLITNEKAQHILEKLNESRRIEEQIKGITNSLCFSCAKIINQEYDEEERGVGSD